MTVNITRLREIDKFIKCEATGTPEVFASKLGVLQATLFRYLHFLRKHGAPLDYSSYKRTYFYKEKGSINISFKSETH
ncbi:MAG: hypothetical protein J7K64_08265 [Bacteroidales bacterium]|nr:hypothetical protein [Bacteroidales bacterium]